MKLEEKFEEEFNKYSWGYQIKIIGNMIFKLLKEEDKKEIINILDE